MSSHQHGYARAFKLVAGLCATLLAGACRDAPVEPRVGELKSAVVVVDSSNFYYYEHKPVYLVENATQIFAETRDSGSDSGKVGTIVGPLLRAVAMRADGVSPVGSGSTGYVLKLPASSLSAAAAARKALALDGRFKAVLPTYRTVDGNTPLIVLNAVMAKFKPHVGLAQIQKVVSSLGGVITKAPNSQSYRDFYLIEPRADAGVSPLQLANAIDRSSIALWASPDMIHPALVPTSLPTDTYFPFQYYLKNADTLNGAHIDIDVERAWDLTKGSPSIRIIFIDYGVDEFHPEFTARSGSFVGYDAMAALAMEPGEGAGHPSVGESRDEHGTLVAGIAIAAHDGQGVAGIAPGVSFGAARIFRGPRQASESDMATAIKWAADHGDVINNSWGECGNPTSPLTDAVNYALSHGRGGKGAVVVFSAGNADVQLGCSAATGQTWISRIPGVIAVAALTRSGEHADYSLPGPAITVSAFGGARNESTCFLYDLYSTILHYTSTGCNDPNVTGAYSSSFGATSGAAPQVSGVAALLLSREPNLTSAQVKSRIMAGAVPWGSSTMFGAGKLSAYNTLVPPVAFRASVSGPTRITTAGTYTWTANVTGATGPVTYQWQVSSNGSTWTNGGGAVASTFTRTERTSETYFLRVIVTQGLQSTTSASYEVVVVIGGGPPH
jgi:subtilisin family serine protease